MTVSVSKPVKYGPAVNELQSLSKKTGILDSILGLMTPILAFLSKLPFQLPGGVDERPKCRSFHDLSLTRGYRSCHVSRSV